MKKGLYAVLKKHECFVGIIVFKHGRCRVTIERVESNKNTVALIVSEFLYSNKSNAKRAGKKIATKLGLKFYDTTIKGE